MNQQQTLRYFLGANSANGFYSLYESFASPEDGDFLWIIKGGAGCGKSSFMKMLGSSAEDAGLDVEYALCSGDPSSLDGVYLPALKTGYMDGTAPHLRDAHIAAIDSAYIDMGTLYDIEAIAEHGTELRELFKASAAKYKKANALLRAAGALRTDWQSGFASQAERENALKRINGIIGREIGKRRVKGGRITKRFLSALSCSGEMSLMETAEKLCNRFYLLDNRLQLGEYVLPKIAEAAMAAGHRVIACPLPLAPNVLEAVLIPGLSLGFVCSTSGLGGAAPFRRIRLDAFFEGETAKPLRPEIRRCEKLTEALQNEAISALSEAKKLHDKIESIYNPHVDFDGAYALVRQHQSALGLK
ncbi:MAG: hypothetical protein RSF77_05600 [Oscillospiraceae bacterium]